MKEFTVDLEIARELERYDFPQNSKFEWCLYKEKYSENRHWDMFFVELNEDNHRCINIISAPMAEEILKELPDTLNHKGLICEPFAKSSMYNVYYLGTKIYFWDKNYLMLLQKCIFI